MNHEEFLEAYLPTKKQNTVINVGAHDGYWCEKFVPLFRKIVAIEANPFAASKLRKRNLENVQVIDSAGWICGNQIMDFNVRTSLPHQSALACRDLLREEGVAQTIRVQTIAIDELKLESCDLIWVDCEGAEVQVMMGATRTIEAFHPQLVIECHEIEHRQWMMTWLERAGYNLAIVHNPQHEQGDSLWSRNPHLIGHYWRYRGTW